MVKKYLEQLISMMKSLNIKQFGNILEFKHFFSGAAVYSDKKICISLTPVGFAIKLAEFKRNELLKQEGTKQLQYFPKAPIKIEYVVISDEIVNNRDILQDLVNQSIAYAMK